MSNEEQQFRPGSTIAGTVYRVHELIGSGGMGNVYRVEHVELGKMFVLKALHRHLASRSDLVARMRNEWRALARLNHPNIVQVTDAGTTAAGLPYFVMENLEGATVAQVLAERGRIPLRAASAIMADVLAGLGAAHQAGAIHRDIKPPNIFLVEDGTTKLLDFGIAKLRDQAARVVTAGGVSIGTPRYMAPEQAEGTQVDGRVDIYAAGLVLYQLLVGRGPFAHIHDPNELVMAHMTIEPERADLIDASIPPEVGDLLQRWLAKAPGNRPPTAEIARRELLALVESFPTDEDVEASEATWAGGAYDASTFGAQGDLRQRSFPVSERLPQAAPDSTSFLPVSRTETLIEEVADRGAATPSNADAAHSPRPVKTLGWGTREESQKTPLHDEQPGVSVPSVNPPPTSTVRPPRARLPSSVKWMGTTALISFLLAWLAAQAWLRWAESGKDSAPQMRAPAATGGRAAGARDRVEAKQSSEAEDSHSPAEPAERKPAQVVPLSGEVPEEAHPGAPAGPAPTVDSPPSSPAPSGKSPAPPRPPVPKRQPAPALPGSGLW